MSVDVITGADIARPPAEVFAYATDPDHAPEWYVNIKSVEWKTPKPLAVGSHITFNAQFLGRRLEYTYEVTELVPNERFVMRTAQGPFPMETSYTFARNEDGSTHMTLRNRGNPSGFAAVLTPFMAGAMRKANQKDLALLKRIVESST